MWTSSEFYRRNSAEPNTAVPAPSTRRYAVGVPALVAALALGACGDDGRAAEVDASAAVDSSPATDAPTPGVDAAAGLDAGPVVDAGPTTTRIVFLNFDGASLTKADTDDATTGMASGIISSQTIPAFDHTDLYDEGEMTRAQVIAAIVDQIRASHADFNVEFVTAQPSSGPYTMIVFGGECNAVTGQTNCAGYGEYDCADTTENNVAFVFAPGLRIADAAATASHWFGHSLGLDDTVEPTDLMYPILQPTIPTQYGSGDAVQPSICGISYQDSYQKMLAALGPSS